MSKFVIFYLNASVVYFNVRSSDIMSQKRDKDIETAPQIALTIIILIELQ